MTRTPLTRLTRLTRLTLAALVLLGTTTPLLHCAGGRQTGTSAPEEPRERAAWEVFAVDPDAEVEVLEERFTGTLEGRTVADLRETLDALPDVATISIQAVVEGLTPGTAYVDVVELIDGEPVAGYQLTLSGDATLDESGAAIPQWRVDAIDGPELSWPRRRRPRMSLSISPGEDEERRR